jgi:DnaJ-class molecular chaperone with C-terminal Zn finger domain
MKKFYIALMCIVFGVAGSVSAMGNGIFRRVVSSYEILRNDPGNIRVLFPQLPRDGEIRWHHILGLNPDATQDEIRNAARRLQMRTHPDRGGITANASAFQAVQDAVNETRGVAAAIEIQHIVPEEMPRNLPRTTLGEVYNAAMRQRNPNWQETPLPGDELKAAYRSHYFLKGGFYALVVGSLIGSKLYEKYKKNITVEDEKDADKKSVSRLDVVKNQFIKVKNIFLGGKKRVKAAKILVGYVMIASGLYSPIKFATLNVSPIFARAFEPQSVHFHDARIILNSQNGHPIAYMDESEFTQANDQRRKYVFPMQSVFAAEVIAGCALIINGIFT